MTEREILRKVKSQLQNPWESVSVFYRESIVEGGTLKEYVITGKRPSDGQDFYVVMDTENGILAESEINCQAKRFDSQGDQNCKCTSSNEPDYAECEMHDPTLFKTERHWTKLYLSKQA